MAKKFKAKPFQNWLDELAKAVVKFRDNNICQIRQSEGCTGPFQIADPYNCQWVHIYTRNSRFVRWDTYNSICGCGSCHAWGHKNPEEFIAWLKKKYPKRYNYLNTPLQGTPSGAGPSRRNVTLGSWKEDTYLMFEQMLIDEAVYLKMPYDKLPQRYWKRYQKIQAGIK